MCGGSTVVTTGSLRSGNTKSCGCLRKEMLVKRQTVHGMAKSQERHPLYIVWASMKSRCYNPNEPSYKNYGGRGIKMCDEWMDFVPFMKWALNNGYREGLEIDRIDNNGNYEPGNCRFVTRSENQLNKRNNRCITIDGVTKTVSEWAEIAGLPLTTIYSRLRYGWSGKRLLLPSGQYEGWKKSKRDALGRFTSATKEEVTGTEG